MTKVAVVAHAGKSFAGGLMELRRELERQGVADPVWVEVPKSRFAPKQVKRVLADGADLLFVWGGDGTVQRSIDAMGGSETPLAILPAGTANLLATNLGIPQDIEQAVRIGLYGARRKLDVGRFNGERFAVMAGAGFDAAMIRQADGTLKDRFGRAAYVWTGSQNLRVKPFKAKIEVDGAPWYTGAASCILFGNVGRLFGGVEVFHDARPDDGRLELGVVRTGRAARLAGQRLTLGLGGLVLDGRRLGVLENVPEEAGLLSCCAAALRAVRHGRSTVGECRTPSPEGLQAPGNRWCVWTTTLAYVATRPQSADDPVSL